MSAKGQKQTFRDMSLGACELISLLLPQSSDFGKPAPHELLELFGGRREDGVAHAKR
jgi:hypothetical protein